MEETPTGKPKYTFWISSGTVTKNDEFYINWFAFSLFILSLRLCLYLWFCLCPCLWWCHWWWCFVINSPAQPSLSIWKWVPVNVVHCLCLWVLVCLCFWLCLCLCLWGWHWWWCFVINSPLQLSIWKWIPLKVCTNLNRERISPVPNNSLQLDNLNTTSTDTWGHMKTHTLSTSLLIILFNWTRWIAPNLWMF